MPRQRKPQNGGQRLWTGRVANTTTGSTTTQTVYRVPTRGAYGECEKLAYEVVWTSPVQVHIEWENVYRVSLDMSALESAIENMQLDLSSVTLETINWNVTFTGSITAEWEFTWTVVNATTVNATAVNADTATIDNLTAATSDLWTATATSVTTDTLTVNETSTFTWDVTAESDLSVAWNLTATTWDIATLTSTDATITNLSATAWDITSLTSDNATFEWLAVNGQSSFTGAMTAGDISATNLWVSWNTTLNNLTTTWNTSLNWATVNGNLAVSWNETVTWNATVAWTSTFNWAVTMSDDLTVVDDLNVQGSSHLNALETTGSVDVAWTLRVDWAIDAWNWVSVTWQVESDSVVTTNTVTNNLTVNGNIALWNDATAPDFVLQSEKWQPNWVAPLDVNWKISTSFLPPVYTTAIVKMGTGVFSNSDTSVVVDSAITADSFVAISNYSDIIWDLNEVINIWQLTVVSNQTETGSYKYIIVNPTTNNNSNIGYTNI